MSLNEELLENPLGFAKKYCILGDDKAKHVQAKDQRSVDGYKFSKMQGLEKISYLNCTKVDLAAELNSGQVLADKAKAEGKIMKNEGAETVFVTAQAQAAGLVPAWFLPWDPRGGMVKLSIPSMSGFSTTWKANDASSYWERDKKHVDEYPRFFLTAAINGCSVFVTGNEREPTVFHGGKGGSVEGDAVEVWRNMLAEVDKPKPPKENMFFREEPKERIAVGEANKSQYVNEPGVKDNDGYNTTGTTNQFQRALNNALKKSPIKIRSVRPWGAVFGICDEFGYWKFYLQENATIRYDVVEKIALGPLTKAPKPFSISRPMLVRQIFPDQGGTAIMRNEFTILPLPVRNLG
jgi:hypothetical protein